MEGTPIVIKNLEFKYEKNGKTTLEIENLEIQKGSRILLLGSNGAGKSTLLRLIAGMHFVSRESVQIFSHSAFHDTHFSNQTVSFLGDAWSRTVPFLGGNVPYSADITVRDMLRTRLESEIKKGGSEVKKGGSETKQGGSGVSQGLDLDRIDRLLLLLEVDLSWKMHEVSDGQRKRVMILLKLLKPFPILLLDEVTTHLDVCARSQFLDFLKEETEQRGVTIVYATHIFDGMEDWASEIVHLSFGKIKRRGKISDFQEFLLLKEQKVGDPLWKVGISWLNQEREEREKGEKGGDEGLKRQKMDWNFS